MDPVAVTYRTGLIESIILLVLVLIAFGCITILARDRWLDLGVTESLLARLAAATLIAAVAVGGMSAVILNLLQGPAFTDTGLSVTASRNQAVLGIGGVLALTIIGIIRIEVYHRRLVQPPAHEEDADWKVEPPEAAGRR
jgi:hypothetical protein